MKINLKFTLIASAIVILSGCGGVDGKITTNNEGFNFEKVAGYVVATEQSDDVKDAFQDINDAVKAVSRREWNRTDDFLAKTDNLKKLVAKIDAEKTDEYLATIDQVATTYKENQALSLVVNKHLQEQYDDGAVALKKAHEINAKKLKERNVLIDKAKKLKVIADENYQIALKAFRSAESQYHVNVRQAIAEQSIAYDAQKFEPSIVFEAYQLRDANNCNEFRNEIRKNNKTSFVKGVGKYCFSLREKRLLKSHQPDEVNVLAITEFNKMAQELFDKKKAFDGIYDLAEFYPSSAYAKSLSASKAVKQAEIITKNKYGSERELLRAFKKTESKLARHYPSSLFDDNQKIKIDTSKFNREIQSYAAEKGIELIEPMSLWFDLNPNDKAPRSLMNSYANQYKEQHLLAFEIDDDGSFTLPSEATNSSMIIFDFAAYDKAKEVYFYKGNLDDDLLISLRKDAKRNRHGLNAVITSGGLKSRG